MWVTPAFGDEKCSFTTSPAEPLEPLATFAPRSARAIHLQRLPFRCFGWHREERHGNRAVEDGKRFPVRCQSWVGSAGRRWGLAAILWRESMSAGMATDMAPTTFVFILGTGRCGSSLLHEILAQHEDVGFLSNIEDLTAGPPAVGRWNGPLFRRLPPAFSRKGRVRFAPSEGYRILDRRVSPAISAPARDLTSADATPWLGGRFRRFFEERARVQSSPAFIHKFTGWPRAGFISAVFPEARFVHVVRDGRAVANSLLQMPWWKGYRGPEGWGWGPLPEEYEGKWKASRRSFPVLAGLEWRLLMDAYEEAKAAVRQDSWMDVRYEDLIRDPLATTKQIIDFMGSPWTASFEGRFRRYHLDSGRTEAFRDDLKPGDVERIEDVLGGVLERWGYSGTSVRKRV